MRTIRTAATLGVATALLLSACSGSDDSPSGDGTLEQTEVTVGVLPIADYAAVYWAEENGLFEAEGLDVTIEAIQGAPMGIQSVASGELDFSIANTISTSISQAQGAPVTAVAQLSSLGEGGGIVWTRDDSDIETVADLDGQTLGNNTIHNIGDVAFMNLALSEGLDIEPEVVEVPFPEMIAGIESGSIDAGYTPEPFTSAAREAGLREVANVTTGPNLHMAASILITSENFASQNPETTAAFTRALYAAAEDITENEDGFRAWLPSITQVDEQVAANMVLPVFALELDLDSLQEVADMIKAQGLVPEDFDIADHITEVG